MGFLKMIKTAHSVLFGVLVVFLLMPNFAIAGEVQFFPPIAPDLNTVCPAGQIRALAWDGSKQIQCIPLPPTCPAGSALNFATSVSNGMTTGSFYCKPLLSGSSGYYNTNGQPTSNGCASAVYAFCPPGSVVIGMDACSNGPGTTATVAVQCEPFN